MVADGLYVKFNAGYKIQLSFRLLGTSSDTLAAPLLLLHPPTTLSHTPSEEAIPSPQSMCACGARVGMDITGYPDDAASEDLDADGGSTATSRPPRLTLQALIEMQAVSCLCTSPLLSSGVSSIECVVCDGLYRMRFPWCSL